MWRCLSSFRKQEMQRKQSFTRMIARVQMSFTSGKTILRCREVKSISARFQSSRTLHMDAERSGLRDVSKCARHGSRRLFCYSSMCIFGIMRGNRSFGGHACHQVTLTSESWTRTTSTSLSVGGKCGRVELKVHRLHCIGTCYLRSA